MNLDLLKEYIIMRALSQRENVYSKKDPKKKREGKAFCQALVYAHYGVPVPEKLKKDSNTGDLFNE